MKLMKLMKPILLAITLFMAFASPAFANQDSIYTGRYSDVAIQGYDSVAYFTQGEPLKGSSEFATQYMGAEFRFSTQQNLDDFLKMPANYTPQYGGHCAWAVSQGYTAKGDARHWRIVDGKLYLNYNGKIQKRWETNIEGFIVDANKNWPSVLEK